MLLVSLKVLLNVLLLSLLMFENIVCYDGFVVVVVGVVVVVVVVADVTELLPTTRLLLFDWSIIKALEIRCCIFSQ